MTCEIDVPHPAAAQPNQSVPVAGEWELQHHADYTVIVKLDLAVELLATLEDQCIDGLDHRRALITDVAGGRMLQRRLLQGARAEDFTQLVETDFLTDVELNQNQDRAADGGFNRGSHFGFLRAVDGEGGFGIPDHSWCQPAFGASC